MGQVKLRRLPKVDGQLQVIAAAHHRLRLQNLLPAQRVEAGVSLRELKTDPRDSPLQANCSATLKNPARQEHARLRSLCLHQSGDRGFRRRLYLDPPIAYN